MTAAEVVEDRAARRRDREVLRRHDHAMRAIRDLDSVQDKPVRVLLLDWVLTGRLPEQGE